jgi:hypothetical protein
VSGAQGFACVCMCVYARAEPLLLALFWILSLFMPLATLVCASMSLDHAHYRRYAAALRTLYASHGSDLEVATLFAEALINRTPWRLWDLDTGARGCRSCKPWLCGTSQRLHPVD